MSNSTNNFVHELVVMAKAMEELPIVKAELEDAKKAHAIDSDTIQRLELRIIDLKSALDSQIKLTLKAEADRDEAVMAFLEAEDKQHRAMDVLKTFMGDASDFLRAVEPPKPEPVQTEPTEVVVDQSDPLPSAGLQAQPSPATPETSTDTVSSITSPEGAGLSGSTGERAEGPTAGMASDTVQSVSHQPTGVASESTVTEPGASGFDAPLDAEVRDSVDPIVSVSPEPSVSTMPNAGEPSQSEPTPQDDVGYHNEPEYTTGDDTWHSRWQAWAAKMNERFGDANWPARTHFA